MDHRRTGRVSLDRTGSEKWTARSLATKYCATGPELRISTAKPTVCTARCELTLHNEDFIGVTTSVSWRPATAAFLTQNGLAANATVLPNRAHVWYKGDGGLWWLGKIRASPAAGRLYLVRFLDDPGPIKLPLSRAHYTTSTGAVRGYWCLQVHLVSAFAPGVCS